MQFTEILSRLDSVSESTDGGFTAACPAHADSRPSLRVWVGENRKVRLTCRAGCAADDVVSAMGLEWRDMFDVEGDVPTIPSEKPAIVGGSHIAALASYLDSAGEEFVHSPAAHEYALKRFGVSLELGNALGLGYDDCDGYGFKHASRTYTKYPRLVVPLNDFAGRPKGLQGRDLSGECSHRWVSLTNPQGHRWAAYGVFRGQGGYGATVVSEGPGDGLTAVALGYDAVVIRGAALAGSPELLAELASGLRGQQVIAAGDNDAAGKRFNRALADGLAEHGIAVYELRIPHDGADLTRWREIDPDAFDYRFHQAVKHAAPIGRPRNEPSAEVSRRTGAEPVTADHGHEAAAVLADLVKQYGSASDVLNAYALVAWTDGRVKYAPGLGFYVFDGRIWQRSDVRVRQEIHRMGAALMLSGDSEAAKGFNSTTRIDNLLTELRSVPSVYVDPDEFDARPELLCFRNGTVDLESGELRPHDKGDMLTVMLDADYDPEARAPRWEQFLAEIMPGHPEMVDYLQRLTGYGITGHTSEQCFTVLHGKGANGKSVFTDTLTEVFKEITTTAPYETFEAKQSGGVPNDVARLRGARLVMAAEGESNKPMSEALIKRMTGKDKMSARFLRQEFFEFRPTFQIILSTNHKPSFRGQDEGLWRRVKLVPFARYFAKHERDYHLDTKLLSERAGIIAWAVRGAQQWFRQGLDDPELIRQATADYKETSDALNGFIGDVIEITGDDADTILGSDLYRAYVAWSDEEGLSKAEVWKRTTLYRAMDERGCQRRKGSAGMTFYGLREVASHEPAGPGIFSDN
ncbi:phage/plasmid primase, P4 family [Streptomyces lycii]|uniref:SF3 helicase domain-containing protein n=1 Tax=Streptomyces lycii TaxID=2654337 RepID=A0ABQ7FI77_9ACTN|nr:phage/plasmid primase, P4 family [Streptomyces lycii]KAF4408627.1 hypothetical protein GCU69_13085 [Streptomyces lycii]